MTKTPTQKLLKACQDGKFAEARAAIQEGADVNGTNGKTYTQPLDWAARSGNAMLCGYLLDYGADVNTSLKAEGIGHRKVGLALRDAMDRDHRDVVELLVHRGISFHAALYVGRHR